jgi:hypothetical protein
MTTPIETMLASVEWVPAEPAAQRAPGGLPYATHSGVLDLFGTKLRCYRLNTGQAVFDADDVKDFFGGLIG